MIPAPAANETALRIRSSIVSRETPSAASFASEIGLSITEAGTPSSTSASTSAWTAREKPQTSARRPAATTSSTARQSSAETRGKPASIRSMPAASRAPRDLELVLGREHDADRLLPVAERRVVEADRVARLRVERLLVEAARPDLAPVDHWVTSGPGRSRCTIPSGKPRASRRPTRGDQEVVLDAQAAAALHSSILARLQEPCPPRTSPPPAWCAYGGSWARAPTPWQIGCDRLAREPESPRSPPGSAGRARAGSPRDAERDRVVVDAHQPLLELAVAVRELAGDEVLRVIGTSSRRRRPRSRTASARPRRRAGQRWP